MAELDDLKAAVLGEQSELADLADAQSKLAADIDAALAKISVPGVSLADVESAAKSISAANASLKSQADAMRASASKLESALNPPPPAPAA